MRQAATTRIIPTELSTAVFTVVPPRSICCHRIPGTGRKLRATPLMTSPYARCSIPMIYSTPVRRAFRNSNNQAISLVRVAVAGAGPPVVAVSLPSPAADEAGHSRVRKVTASPSTAPRAQRCLCAVPLRCCLQSAFPQVPAPDEREVSLYVDRHLRRTPGARRQRRRLPYQPSVPRSGPEPAHGRGGRATRLLGRARQPRPAWAARARRTRRLGLRAGGDAGRSRADGPVPGPGAVRPDRDHQRRAGCGRIR